MRFEMKMPDLAATESEIRIVRWIVRPGQKVNRGEPLLEVETDKATMEVESVVSGVFSEARSQVDESVSVGDVIAVLEVEEAAGLSTKPVPSSAAATSAIPPPVAAGPALRPAGGPTGMFARNRAAAAATVAEPAKGIPLGIAQRTAARRLQESKQTIPHFYLQTSVNATAVIARRNAGHAAKPVWDAFFVLAAARALERFERFRCRFDGERLAPAETDAIGVAVDRDEELFVIPIASPAVKTLEEISDEIRRSVERIVSGKPEARRISPALMTVTNLGVANVESFIPIINPPEAAILVRAARA